MKSNLLMYILFFILIELFISYSNLDVFLTYNHVALRFLRSSYNVKVSMVLTIADNLFLHNYIKSLLNIILKPILFTRTELKPASYYLYL